MAVELHLEPEDENNVRRQCIAFSNELKERLLDKKKLAGTIMALVVELLGCCPAEIDKIVQR